MSIKSTLQSRGRKWLVGIILVVLACLLLVLAWQSVSTDQYALYRDNVARYEQEAAACLALSEGTYGSNYAYLASQWQALADDAHRYLAQHRSGAACLCIVSALFLLIALWCFWPRRKREAHPATGPQPAHRTGPQTAPQPAPGVPGEGSQS